MDRNNVWIYLNVFHQSKDWNCSYVVKLKKNTFNSGLIFDVLKHQRHVFRNLWNRSFDSNETHIFVYYAT